MEESMIMNGPAKDNEGQLQGQVCPLPGKGGIGSASRKATWGGKRNNALATLRD